ncbi:NAD+ synthase [Candidatus Woesearchaeota archaeon]|nr:NAD+ synthase [Candidatus Woesearchaeota archaeon]
MNTKEICRALVFGIGDYFRKNNFQKAVIGLSGGIDSSVACALAAKALGGKNVMAILMPDLEVTSKESTRDAEDLARKLKIEYEIIEINDFLASFEKINKKLKLKKDIFAIANAKARARMMILYYFVNSSNALVIGTSDKSEIALGYTTKYGDNASDILVLGDLWKSEVIGLGKYLGVPGNILRKKPSAELIAGQTAEKELGAQYKILDKILKMYIEENKSIDGIIKIGFNRKIVHSVAERIRLNEHKRRAAMILRVSERSFHGMEWRMPVTNGFRG